ncbi:fragment of putative beta-agarase (glycoside hydrolase family 50 protein) [Candidatus Sulfopaludibacter sp. SbA3]|nr:fragment of putative beta-agarase (glycoside hydrolase family 50 protein) [Candidatus Sulfopaludibacter sp. SbA3]
MDQPPFIDEFGQWIPADWPGKVTSLDQLKQEWANEEKSLTPRAFDYCKFSGYQSTKVTATGFFRVEQIAGKWWFVDPDGHLYLSMAVPGMGAGGAETRPAGRESYYKALPPPEVAASISGGRGGSMAGFRTWNLFRRYGAEWPAKAAGMELRRAEGWGLTSIVSRGAAAQQRKPYLTYFNTLPRANAGQVPMNLGMPDVYSQEYAQFLEDSAKTQLTPRKDDPWLIGYFIGNEPPWPRRESEVIDMYLAGPPTAMQREIKRFLAEGDTPERRRQFVVSAFEKYLAMVSAALKKYDPNHLNLGIRFGGTPPDYISRTARAFDVYSLNTYEYEPTRQVKAAYELSGRPVIIGEFHFGVPADGLGAGLVQVRDQKERGVAYRYYVEQAAALPGFLGAGWFTGVDESVTGRMDGENYNIGFVDVTDRPYPELVAAAKETFKRLLDVHSGKIPPFSQRPKASDAGTPETPWSNESHGFKFTIN